MTTIVLLFQSGVVQISFNKLAIKQVIHAAKLMYHLNIDQQLAVKLQFVLILAYSPIRTAGIATF